MEVDKIQTQGCNFQRMGNRRVDCNNIGQMMEERYRDDEEDGESKKSGASGGGGDGGKYEIDGVGRYCGWPSSRIIRVSRASGGKDRHSKVWTSKGLRDRRVRLSVPTAIQFYDLQDRLGYDQPSKAVEWLLNAAAKSIDELPPINTSFPDTPRQLSDEKRSSTGGTEQGIDSTEVEMDPDPSNQQQHSSTSDTSKGSGGLTLSRSENRIKARERAKGRRTEREKGRESECRVSSHPNLNPNSQTSFTELLTGCLNNVNSNNNTSSNGPAQQNHGCGEANFLQKSTREWSSAPMDYFTVGNQHSSAFSGHLGNSLPQSMANSPFTGAGEHFSFIPDHLIPVATSGCGNDYNLNFTISSGLAGLNRGTLQSNSPSLFPHAPRLSPMDGSNIPFFIGTSAPNAVAVENHHQFPAGLDGRLQLCYGDSGRLSDQKGKGKP